MASSLARPTRPESPQADLFDRGTSWESEWWGMPHFSMGDARPQHKITVNFMTDNDVKEFAEKTGLPVTTRSDSCWFPHQEKLSGEVYYDGPPTSSFYPVCIPSKGRADCQKTGKALARMGVSYKFFVEETEYDEYCKHVGAANVVKMPFHDLGQGSIPARNFIWEWAKERGHKRHWVMDDNIVCFTRMDNNRRLIVRGGGFFRAMEDFVDRYQNIVMAGPHDQGFVKDRGDVRWPYLLNSRVYSCILLDTSLPHRWRGRYNEDTDLSLRLLKDGYCTLLFHAMLMSKAPTVGVRGCTPMKGGNTDTVYAENDHRLAFAESLKEQHPDCVEVVWKFNRWHHQVDYSPFRGNRLKLKAGVVQSLASNDYGMRLVRASEEATA
jgi:hypothetical protein